MGPSAAWFYEGQLCLHRNWKLLAEQLATGSVKCFASLQVDMLNGNRKNWKPFVEVGSGFENERPVVKTF